MQGRRVEIGGRGAVETHAPAAAAALDALDAVVWRHADVDLLDLAARVCASLRDIPALARHFLEGARRAHGRGPGAFSPDAENALQRFGWPGNVRELQNAVERASILCRAEVVEPRHLLLGEGALRPDGAAPAVRGTLEEMERQLIVAAFEAHGRNKKATARSLDINIKTLRARLRAYGVDAAEDGGEEEDV